MLINNGAIFLRFLQDNNTDHVFALPGKSICEILDLIDKIGPKLIQLNHEQSLVHASEGYSYITQKPSFVFVTSGPGLTNSITGLCNAYVDGHAVVIIAGQVPSHKAREYYFQELPIEQIAKKVCKAIFSIQSKSSLEEELNKSYYLSNLVPEGPVLLTVPSDFWNRNLLTKKCTNANLSAATKLHNKSIDNKKKSKFMKDISSCKKPLIILGQGANKTESSILLNTILSENNIPFTTTLHGLSSLPSAHSMSLGMVGMYGTHRANYALKNCDFLLTIGASLNDRIIGDMNHFAKDAIKYFTNIKRERCESYIFSPKSEFNMLAKDFIDQILINTATPTETLKARQDWLLEIQSLPLILENKNSNRNITRTALIFDWFQNINNFTKPNDFFVADCGSHQMWVALHLEMKSCRQFLTTGGMGTMGFALSASIGASIADPSRLIWCFIGDGGLENTLHEMSSLVRLSVNVRVIVFNNSRYGMIQQIQDTDWGGRHVLSHLERTWTFTGIAAALGIWSRTAQNPQELAVILQEAPTQGPSLIELIIDPELTAPVSIYYKKSKNGTNF